MSFSFVFLWLWRWWLLQHPLQPFPPTAPEVFHIVVGSPLQIRCNFGPFVPILCLQFYHQPFLLCCKLASTTHSKISLSKLRNNQILYIISSIVVLQTLKHSKQQQFFFFLCTKVNFVSIFDFFLISFSLNYSTNLTYISLGKTLVRSNLVSYVRTRITQQINIWMWISCT